MALSVESLTFNQRRVSQFPERRVFSVSRNFPLEVQTCFEREGFFANVPNTLLWGTQPPGEFSWRKQRLVKAALIGEGANFLKRNPLWVVAIPIDKTQSMLVIKDGNHRARFAPLFGIHVLPSLVVSVRNLAITEGKDPADVAADLERQAFIADKAIASRTEGKGKPHRHPEYVDLSLLQAVQI